MDVSVRHPGMRSPEAQLEARAKKHASGHCEAHIEERALSN